MVSIDMRIVRSMFMLCGALTVGCMAHERGAWVFKSATGEVRSGKTPSHDKDDPWRESTKLQSGRLTVWDEQGGRTETSYREGSRDGEELQWAKSGALLCRGCWSNDMRTGEWTLWWPNGVTRSLLRYNKGKLHGKCIEWSENGRQIVEEEYSLGCLSGVVNNWDTNGVLRSQYTFRDGLLDGRARVWLADGSLLSDGEYRKGQRWDGSFLKYSPGPDIHEWIGVMILSNGRCITNHPRSKIAKPLGAGSQIAPEAEKGRAERR